jgi:hypothetical protein
MRAGRCGIETFPHPGTHSQDPRTGRKVRRLARRLGGIVADALGSSRGQGLAYGYGHVDNGFGCRQTFYVEREGVGSFL